jgi:RND family efflux transporter MFP subunit
LKHYHRIAFLIILINIVSDISAEDSLVEAQIAVKSEILSGFTRARTRLVLSAESAGRVLSVSYDTGDVIEEGNPFACIDDTFLDLDLRTKQAEIASLDVDIDFYKKEMKRFTKLFKQNSSSEMKVDSAERSFHKAKTQRLILQLNSEILDEQKQRLCIQPPIGWRVIKRYVEKGQWVNAGEHIVEVGDYTHLAVPFALSMIEYQALKSKEAAGLDVFLPELDAQVSAKLIKVSPAFDAISRKIHLELELSEGLSIRRGGLRVELSLDIPMFTGAVLVPESLLRQQYEQYWLMRPDGTEVSVVYLGKSVGEQDDLVRVVSPDIKPGDKFLSINE